MISEHPVTYLEPMASLQPSALGKLNGLMLTAMIVSSFIYIWNGEMLHPKKKLCGQQRNHRHLLYTVFFSMLDYTVSKTYVNVCHSEILVKIITSSSERDWILFIKYSGNQNFCTGILVEHTVHFFHTVDCLRYVEPSRR
jgi:hypothetical protein